MRITDYLRSLKSDPFVVTLALVTGLLLIWACISLRVIIVLDNRNETINQEFGKDLAYVSREISQRIESQINQLQAIAEQQNVAQHLKDFDISVLNNDETLAISMIDVAEAIFYIDENLVRHQKTLSSAVLQLARISIDNQRPYARAIKIDDEWKVFTSSPLYHNDKIIGLALLKQPLDPFTKPLMGGNSEQSSLHLEQIEANDSVTRLATIGGENGYSVTENAASYSQNYAIQGSDWQLIVDPSAELIERFTSNEISFGLATFAAVVLWILSLLAFHVMRVNRGDSEINIFTSQSRDVRTIRLPAQKERKVESELEEGGVNSGKNTPSDTTEVDAKSPINANEAAGLDDISDLDDLELMITDDDIEFLDEYEIDIEEDYEEPILADDNKFVVPDIVFRDYDIRGVANEQITPEFALRLGKTVGSLVLRRGNNALYLGRDGRSSSEALSLALREGVISTGCNVIDLGEIITPALNYAIHYSGQSTSGVMVTASHNPGNFNGFKIIVQGQVLSGENLQLLKPIMSLDNFTEGKGEYFSRLVIPQYVREIFEDIGIVKEFKVVIDGANSVSGPVAVELFESLGCQVIPLYCDIDGSFPNHEPNPSDEFNLMDLRAKVASEDADLGFAFDGDGDRLVVISKSGHICWPDQLMMLFATDVLQNADGAPIIYDVKSSQSLAEVIQKHKGIPILCKTGHAHVREAVQENNALLGGEFSGHIFFNDRRKCFDDGLYAAARLLEILTATYKSLDQLLDTMDIRAFTGEILIPVQDDKKFALMSQIANECEFRGSRINRLDGLRVEYPQGWGLVRASNTSPNLTLRFEADDHNVLGHIKQTFKFKLSRFIPDIEEYL